jgi:hypothetical protein
MLQWFLTIHFRDSEKYVEWLIQTLQYFTPDKFQLDVYIREVIEDGRESFRNKALNVAVTTEKRSPTNFFFYWHLFMGLLLLVFLMSCISQFAQHYQMTIDNEELAKYRARLEESKVITSVDTTKSTLVRQQISNGTVSTSNMKAILSTTSNECDNQPLIDHNKNDFVKRE